METSLQTAVSAQSAAPTRPIGQAAVPRRAARPLPGYTPAFPARPPASRIRYERTMLGMILMLALLVGLLLTAINEPPGQPYLSTLPGESGLPSPAVAQPPAGPLSAEFLPGRAPVCLPVTGLP